MESIVVWSVVVEGKGELHQHLTQDQATSWWENFKREKYAWLYFFVVELNTWIVYRQSDLSLLSDKMIYPKYLSN